MPRRLKINPELEAETQAWVRAATRKQMALAHLSHRDLALRLVAAGLDENEKSIANKVARGEMSAALFLLCLKVMECETLNLGQWSLREEQSVEWLTLDRALGDERITVLDRDDEAGIYRFRVGLLTTPVKVILERRSAKGATRYTVSHAIPKFGDVGPVIQAERSPPLALRLAIRDLTRAYEAGLNSGEVPEESWLVPKATLPKAKFASWGQYGERAPRKLRDVGQA